eukprot:15227070-Heterocapsa_arctica.AAC.1
MHCLGWQSSRIQRVVRSTLAAEAYSASDAIDTLDWARAVLLELLRPDIPVHEIPRNLSKILAAAVTD